MITGLRELLAGLIIAIIGAALLLAFILWIATLP